MLKHLLRSTGGHDARQETCYRVALPTGQVATTPAQVPQRGASLVGASLCQKVASQSAASQADAPFPTAFFAKFGFAPTADGSALVRHHRPDLTAITLVQQQICLHLAQGGVTASLCIDATCGNGHDSLFLARQLGAGGQLIALDLQQQAVDNTTARLAAAGIAAAQYRVLCADHATLAQHAAPQSADVIVFNFGWLPGAGHEVFSGASSSIPALGAALTTLKPGGLLCATLYSGEGIGDAEKTAVRNWLCALPIAQYTVLVCEFANWASTAPLPCFVWKK